MKRITLAGLLACSLALASLGTIESFASEKDSSHVMQDSHQAEVQSLLDDLANQVTRTANKNHLNGFASVIISVENKEVRVFWKGDTPKSIQKLESLAPAGYRLTFHRADYSAQELQFAVNASFDSELFSGQKIRWAAPNPDGSGITVAVGDTPTLAAHAVIAGVPIKAIHSGEVKATADRLHDTLPYFGGSGISLSPDVCSTGFSMRNPATDERYMLTAAHCGPNGAPALMRDSHDVLRPYGTLERLNKSADTALIKVPANSARVYVGGTQSSTSKPVTGYSPSVVGDLVCANGARSGEHCNVKITHINATVQAKDIGTWTGMSIAEQIDGLGASAEGDSGGPVIVEHANEVWAKGIINGGANETSCYPGGPKVCNKTLIFQPIDKVMINYGMPLAYGTAG